MRIRAGVLALTLLIFPVAARAITLHDLVGLSTAGVGDEVLIALIDADRTVFTLSPSLVADLHVRGVSDRVIARMIRTQEEFGPTNFLIVGVTPMMPPAPPPIMSIPYLVPVPVVEPAIRFRDRERGGDRERRDRHAHTDSNDRKESLDHDGRGISAGLRIRNGEFVR